MGIAPAGSSEKPLKRFRIFPPGDKKLLKYGKRTENANYWFAFDPWQPNYWWHPDVADTYVYEGDMRSGDMLYIPGGSPHAVRNVADNLGVSMNYLDLKTMPDFVRKCNTASPLCNLLAGKGEWVIGALEKRRALGRSLTYYEFAGIENRSDFCRVHSGVDLQHPSETRPALDEYCK